MNNLITRISNLAILTGIVAASSFAATPQSPPGKSNEDFRMIRTEALKPVHHSRTQSGSGIMRTGTQYASIYTPDHRPTRLPGQGVDLYGSVLFSDGDLSRSLYKWPVTSTGSPQLAISGVQAQSAVIDNGLYYALMPGDGYYDGVSVKIYDLATGSMVNSWTGFDTSLMNWGIDKDPVTGDFYGVFYDEDGYSVQLATVRFDGAKPVRTRTIGTLNSNQAWYGFSIDSNGVMYGICGEIYSNAYLYRIDRNTAAMTKIGNTGYEPVYNTAACFDRTDNTLYWTVSTESIYDEPAYMTKVNTSTGAATSIYRLPGDERVGGLAIPRSSIAAGSPAACENVNVSFAGSSLTGTVTLTTPTLLKNGQAGTGSLSVKVKANDTDVASQQAGWGQNVTLNVTMAEPGKYNFCVYAENAEGEGDPVSLYGIFVGPDAPKAPASASLTYDNQTMTVTWTPVTESVNGGWIDVDNITYTVTRQPDNIEVASGLTATTFSQEYAEPDDGVQLYYEVVAVSGDMTSAPTETNKISLGSIVPPYTSDFAQTGLDGYTIIDANGDGKKWDIVTDNGDKVVKINYNTNLDMDDWLITPAIKLEAGKTYDFSVATKCNSQTYPERLEVKVGTEPTAAMMTETVIPATAVTTTSYKTLTGSIVPPATGKYYIGFHGISDADQYALFIREYTIGAGVAKALPMPVTDLSVTPAADYSLNATIAFSAPVKDIYDTNLTSLTKIEILRGEDLVKTFDNPAPGAALEFTDQVDLIGTYTYTVYVYNESGCSTPESKSAYIGAPIPATPTVVNAAYGSDLNSVTISWQAVTTDEDGNPINEAAVNYGIAAPDAEGDWVIVADGITGTNHTMTDICPAGDQMFTQYAVAAHTAAGWSMAKVAPSLPAGTPYSSVYETFADGKTHYIWSADASMGGRWSIMSVEGSTLFAPVDDDDYVIAMQGSNLDSSADLFSGLINLAELPQPALSVQVYNQSTSDNGANVNELIVSVKTLNSTEFIPILHKTIQELAPTRSWREVVVDLEQYAGQTVQVMFTVIVKQYQTTVLDDIRVYSQQTDLSAPADLTAVAEGQAVVLSWSMPESATVSPTGYRIYRDNVMIGESAETTYTDHSVVADTSYEYYVTAVYATGESAASNMITAGVFTGVNAPGTGHLSIAATAGCIVIDNAESLNVVIASADGKAVYRGKGTPHTCVRVAPGVYLVKAGEQNVKVMVK